MQWLKCFGSVEKFSPFWLHNMKASTEAFLILEFIVIAQSEIWLLNYMPLF